MLKKKIPTMFALIILIAGAFLGVLFLDQDTGFLPRAAPETPPQNVRITNITDTSFVITWTTSDSSIGFVKLGSEPTDTTISYQDDRDQLTGNVGSFRTHYVSITGLNPTTQYYFKIGGQNNNLFDQKGKAYSVMTAPTIKQPEVTRNLTGTILNPVSTPAEGAMIYLTFASSTPLSALVKQNGNWNINLNLARTQDLSSIVEYQPGSTELEILINNGSNPNTVIFTTPDELELTPIIIGKNILEQNLDTDNPNVNNSQTLGAQDIAIPAQENNQQQIVASSQNQKPTATSTSNNTTLPAVFILTGLGLFMVGFIFSIKSIS